MGILVGRFAVPYQKPNRINNDNNYPPSSSSSSSNANSNNNIDTDQSFVHFDASVAELDWNPFDLKRTGAPEDASLLQPPLSFHPPAETDDALDDDDDPRRMLLGYIRQPDSVNGTVVFVSEGELYWTRLLPKDYDDNAPYSLVAAVKLTSCRPGQVQHPRLNPVYPYLIAFVANYQGVNEVYLLDTRRRSNRHAGGAQRLTYTDSHLGVTAVVGWKDAGQTVVYGALSTAVGLRDARLYEISLVHQQQERHQQQSPLLSSSNQPDVVTVLDTRPVPLAQAVEGVWWQSTTTATPAPSSCLYFVRVKQYSFTARYVGGTAEQLWAYCDNREIAVPLGTNLYAGTSKSPQIFTDPINGLPYLLFLSDRSWNHTTTSSSSSFVEPEWTPTTMNLWASRLPMETDLYNPDGTAKILGQMGPFIQLTNVACQFNGMTLLEYTSDVDTGNILLRVGADLFWLSSDKVHRLLTSKTTVDSASIPRPSSVYIQINSDFAEQQERIIEIDMKEHLSEADVFETDFGMTGFLMTVRGQLWVIPVTADASQTIPFQGSGQNLPERRYRVIPGAYTGGVMRVFQALVAPTPGLAQTNGTVWTLVLATDPVSITGEVGFYIVEVQPSHVNSFTDLGRLPDPFVGGHVNGGSSLNGGLGTVKKGSLAISPCGRRFAWADLDNRICTMTLPMYTFSSEDNNGSKARSFHCLPKENNLKEPMAGTFAELSWSPGGRYLAVEHKARNQMNVISIVDCGNPSGVVLGTVSDIKIASAIQITSNRFNSYDMYWGKSRFDVLLYATMAAAAKSMGLPTPDDVTTTLFYISDRDIINDVTSPWGSRAPMPHFLRLQGQVFAFPLLLQGIPETDESILGRYAGGGGMEVFAEKFASYEKQVLMTMASTGGGHRRRLHDITSKRLAASFGRNLTPDERASVSRMSSSVSADSSLFPIDAEIDFMMNATNISHRAYRMAHIPAGEYLTILSQTNDGSLAMIQRSGESGSNLVLFASEPYPSDGVTAVAAPDVGQHGLSSSRSFIFVVTPMGKFTRVIPNTAQGIASFSRDKDWVEMKVDVDGIAFSVWPSLEYRQLYSDAWRMLRDYFYDPNLHGVNWPSIHKRFEPLVQRCSMREELNDVLSQMISELSALHSYVYIGESTKPKDPLLGQATLAASFKRVPAWNGFMVTDIPENDPDFNTIDRIPIYSPLSDGALRLTGQRGLQVGDVIVAVNGESVMQAPDINMLIRGFLGRSVRLEVLRLKSDDLDTPEKVKPEPLIAVPIHPQSAYMLRVNAWEWRTRQNAKELASASGFTVGYVHLQSMHSSDEDAFARAYYPDYTADAFIIDVRHNDGGFIDSWLLDTLQRKAWMFWAGRSNNLNGGMDWDEQYAFRGKVVILQDEFTASNAEGFCRGISELGLGRLIGKRTWGGGIWGSSANTLVDGGIATAPQWGTFNSKLGWGGGVEMTGVSPDVDVDNNPRMAFDGKDSQLERAILELKLWLMEDPIPEFKTPGERPIKAIQNNTCSS